jgi:hypothetical protein
MRLAQPLAQRLRGRDAQLGCDRPDRRILGLVLATVLDHQAYRALPELPRVLLPRQRRRCQRGASLPSADSVSWQQMTTKREDSDATHRVTLRPQGQQTITGQAQRQLAPEDSLQIYSDGQAWLLV